MKYDTWPLPRFNPGSRDHLHALGVISVTFANLQASIDSIYWHRASVDGHSAKQIETDYFSLKEENRIRAIKALIRREEEAPVFVKAVENLLDFYNWCRNCRNIILHSERYPPAFGGKPDELQMVKWTKATPRKPQYTKFTVKALRDIAEQFRLGVVQSAEINMYMRSRRLRY
jgi:hypothetical protein